MIEVPVEGFSSWTNSQGWGVFKVLKPNLRNPISLNGLGFFRWVYGFTVWSLVGNGGMDYGDYYWGLYRGYYRDPFPHSLLSTRQYCSLLQRSLSVFRSFCLRFSGTHKACITGLSQRAESKESKKSGCTKVYAPAWNHPAENFGAYHKPRVRV